MFKVKVSVEIQKDDQPFAASQCVYSNMDYDTMQLTQRTVIEALLALGDAKVKPAK